MIAGALLAANLHQLKIYREVILDDIMRKSINSYRVLLICIIIVFLSAYSTYANEYNIDVWDFGAKGNGKTDDTSAFQKALNKAGENGGVVIVPPGQYRLNGAISIPAGVALEGSWPGPHASQLDKGSTLLVYGGRDKEESKPFISLNTSSTLKGVTIFYPEQNVNDIHPYPWTIQGQGQNYNIIDVTIANAYNGIDCGTFHNEGHQLRNVLMCALRRGILIDQCTDVGRLENVHIHNVYWWRVDAPYTLKEEEVVGLENYTREHLEGFIIGRTDWEYISNCFVIWAKIGFHFLKTNTSEGGSANALITQSGSDEGPLAVKIDEVQSHAGLAFENCQFMSGFEIGPNNLGPVKLTNCGFWGFNEGEFATGSQMILDGKGTVTLTATHFNDWDWNKKNKPCIEALNGSLLMTNCDFRGFNSSQTHLYLGPDVYSASIIGNRFRQIGKKIINKSRGDIQIFGNVK
ncbi:MAG: hypothetical protein LUQ47_02570 [Methanotrichaceae archaeon]|nr:hypothetical protein [Methanotrichaceae archaeon]